MYEVLLERWKKERTKKDLFPLASNFYSLIRDHLDYLHDELKQIEHGVERLLIRKRIERIQFMLKDLALIRAEKIFSTLCYGEITTDLSKEELEIAARGRAVIDHFFDLIHQTKEVDKEDGSDDLLDEGMRLLMFTKKFASSIKGADLLTYGPFIPGDVVNLPSQTAKVFLRRGDAESIDF